MLEEDIDAILLKIVEEFIKPENASFIEEQKLASSIFYSFAVGTINGDEVVEEKIDNLKYVIDWIHDHEGILKGYNMRDD